MYINYMTKPSLTAGTVLLSAFSPLQTLLDKPGITHEFCNHQALLILKQDGFKKEADFITKYAKELDMGVYWADQGWKNTGHYWVPTSGKGLWQFNNALINFNDYYLSSLSLAQQGQYAKSIFLLGAAAHLVQDACVPHHAQGKLFSGHKEYETWAQQHHQDYGAKGNGIYLENKKTENLLCSNAALAADLFSWVKHAGITSYYHAATEILLPLAQRSTAGLFWHYTAQLAKSDRKLTA